MVRRRTKQSKTAPMQKAVHIIIIMGVIIAVLSRGGMKQSREAGVRLLPGFCVVVWGFFEFPEHIVKGRNVPHC